MKGALVDSGLVAPGTVLTQEAERVQRDSPVLRERVATLRARARAILAHSAAVQARALQLMEQSRRLLRTSRSIRRNGCSARAGHSSWAVGLKCNLAWRLVATLVVLAGRCATSSTVRFPRAWPRVPAVSAIGHKNPRRVRPVSTCGKPPSLSGGASSSHLSGDGRTAKPPVRHVSRPSVVRCIRSARVRALCSPAVGSFEIADRSGDFSSCPAVRRRNGGERTAESVSRLRPSGRAGR